MKLDDLLKKLCYGSKIVIIDCNYDILFDGDFSQSTYEKFTYTMKQKEIVVDIFCSDIGRVLIKINQ